MAARQVSLVLSGGIALGSYEAGAYAALHEHEDLRPRRLAGSSIGAVNAAVIAGNAPEQRVARLREFWDAVSVTPIPFEAPWTAGPWRHASNWMSVLQTRLFGRAGVFHPRGPGLSQTSLYDLSPLRDQLTRVVDFDRLNAGELRVSVVTTDVVSGEGVVFDTHRGDRIGPDHLLATCGFLPDFAPIEIDGRLLGDGGLVSNAPIETALFDEDGEDDLLCFVVDLVSPAGQRPATLEQAAGRRWDLLFGNQSRSTLRRVERELELRRQLGRLVDEISEERIAQAGLTAAGRGAIRRNVTLLHLCYAAPAHEAGPEKPFDFGRASLAERWETGFLDMVQAVRVAESQASTGIVIRRVQR